jgi:hypothetical protein
VLVCVHVAAVHVVQLGWLKIAPETTRDHDVLVVCPQQMLEAVCILIPERSGGEVVRCVYCVGVGAHEWGGGGGGWGWGGGGGC